MQNSAKLIYVGVILLVIIIIVTMGMYIMGQTQEFTDKANVSLGDNNEFNNTWAAYKGKQKGSNTKIMITSIIKNAKENKTEPSMLLDIIYKAREADDYSIIKSTKKISNIDDMQELQKKLDINHFYTVDFVYSEKTGQMTAIVIKYHEKDKVDLVPDET